jgi:hypothetical protein
MTFANGPLPSAPLGQGTKIAVASGQTVQVCVWVKADSTYNGLAPTLVERLNPAMGVNADTVKATYSGGTSWQQICGTTNVAPADGIFEFVVNAQASAGTIASPQTPAGFVNVAEWSTTN